MWVIAGRPGAEKPDHGHRRLLRACRQRPRRYAAEQCDQFAACHSITSSARASRVGGMSRVSDLAVLRLIAVSYRVGCCTGRWAGLAPLKIRSAWLAITGARSVKLALYDIRIPACTADF